MAGPLVGDAQLTLEKFEEFLLFVGDLTVEKDEERSERKGFLTGGDVCADGLRDGTNPCRDALRGYAQGNEFDGASERLAVEVFEARCRQDLCGECTRFTLLEHSIDASRDRGHFDQRLHGFFGRAGPHRRRHDALVLLNLFRKSRHRGASIVQSPERSVTTITEHTPRPHGPSRSVRSMCRRIGAELSIRHIMVFDALPAPPARTALRYGDVTLSHGELRDRATAHANTLRDAGIAPGDRVAVWATPEPDTLVMLYGNMLSGVVSVPLNPAVGVRELQHILQDAAPRAVLGRAPEGRSFDHDFPTPSRRAHEVVRDARAPALVLYTSGTTGLPKGVVLSHEALASNLDALASVWAWSPDDELVHALPLFHVHGLVLGVFGSLRRGAAITLLPRFDPAAVTAALARSATMFFGVPTMYHRLAELVEHDPDAARALARARLLVSGSAPLPLREHRRLQTVTGRGVLERYGLTETLINTAVRLSEGPRPGSVGHALPGVSLRLVDEARSPLDARDDITLGEVAVRGPNLFEGYLNRPDATEAVRDAEGWFYTGDLATMAPDGAIRIVGRRATDLIKTGGYKVGAGEVETALLEHPDVREAAVKGVADDDLGERIEAWVVLREGASTRGDELIDHVASLLAWHKRPRRVHVVTALPRNAMGKVRKTELGETSQ